MTQQHIAKHGEPTPDTSSDVMERVARAICLAAYEGHDPDELVTHKPPSDEAWFEEDVAEGERENEECWFVLDGDYFAYWKRWRSYAPHARAAIAALTHAE